MPVRAPEFRVVSYSRRDFLERVWRYEAGEHVSFICPTKGGKTTLAYQLLARTATKELPAVVLVMKPRDATVVKFTKAAHYRIARTWPPPPSVWQPGKQAGYVLWPPHSRDPDYDEVAHEEIFREALRHSYVKGDRIVFADEVYSLAEEYGLRRPLIRIWTKGRSIGCGLWSATQRPSGVPLWMYSAPEHLFLGHDPDERAQDRFREIGGVNPAMVKHVVSTLPRWHFLYIRREDRTMCVVEAR